MAGLIAAVAVLFQRLSRVERALVEIREGTDRPVPSAEQREPQAAPSSSEIPPTETLAAPAVSLRRSEPQLSADPLSSEPEPEAQAAAPRFAMPAFDFEDLFGRRLPIWAGGVALAVAGVFLVRFSIERGLITPEVRVVMAFVFGLALLAGAELAYRYEARVADPRVRQALAGAGLATLYAGFYLAGTQYGLVGQTVAFLGLAGVTGTAIALSFRFGLPSAVLGLVGGFAAPALVGGEEANVPLLALYLGLVTAGLTLSGRRQQRPWMGIAALVGGLGWGALLLLSGDKGAAELLALGLYVVVLGAVLPALADARAFERPLRLAAALAASVQLALLVDQGGYVPLAWGLYLLLGGTLAWFGWRRPEMREGNAVAATIGVLLLAQWSAPPPMLFAAVAAALALVFGGVPLALLWRGEDRRIDLLQIALVAPALAAVSYATFGAFDPDRPEPLLALASAALAMLPLASAWLLRTRPAPVFFAAELASAAALGWSVLLMLTPAWSAPLAALPILAVLAVLAHRRGGAALANLLWAAAGVTLLALIATPEFLEETPRLASDEGETPMLRALLRWTAAALPFAALAWIENRRDLRRAAEALAAVLAYGALAQVLPSQALAWTAAGLAIGCQSLLSDRPATKITLLAIALLWALDPLAQWFITGADSLVGQPVFVGGLPSAREVLTYLLPTIAASAWLRLPFKFHPQGIDPRWLAAPLALVAAHVFYKQLFAIDTVTRFTAFGMAERTLWEALLLAAAWIAANRLARFDAGRIAGIALAGAALAHGMIYTGLLHNPLWSAQAVGPTPLANWILVAAAVTIGAALLLRQLLEQRMRPWLDGLAMALVSFAALGLLRQIFAGTLPSQLPLGQTEDLLRSLLGILLALLFLWLGSRRGERSWRVGSLVLMLIAVAKVCLFDTAGLEGLLRVASFMALGFSLIGIGWVYSRQLRARPAATAESMG